MTARKIKHRRWRWKSRYLGGSMGRSTGWFDCTNAVEYDGDPRTAMSRCRNVRIVLVVSGQPSR